MITHAGVRYWTTDELAGSLIARGLIGAEGGQRAVRRRAARWANSRRVGPAATTKRGAHLWSEETLKPLLDLTNMGR